MDGKEITEFKRDDYDGWIAMQVYKSEIKKLGKKLI
jgi:hypothetical protein